MTLQQKAFQLMQEQSEKKLKIIVELMKALSSAESVPGKEALQSGKCRIGAGKGIIHLQEDCFPHFDDANEEIAELFYGSEE